MTTTTLVAPLAAQQASPGPFGGDVDQIMKFANMAGPMLPGPAGQALGMVNTLMDLFSGGGPSEAEIIIDAVQQAVKAAVKELEVFITAEKLDDLTADIDAAYHWLSISVDQVRAAGDEAEQVAYARRALGQDQLPSHVARLGRTLDRLTLFITPTDNVGLLKAQARAIRLMAHGAAALFTLEKLWIQFDAFLAQRGGPDPQGVDRRAAAHQDYVQFRHDVQSPAGYVRAFRTMVDQAVATRRTFIAFEEIHSAIMVFAGTRVTDNFTEQSDMIDTPIQDMIEASQHPGLSLEDAAELRKQEYIAAAISGFRRYEGLQAASDQMAAYEALIPGWDTAMADWKTVS
ncbi:hypothetical protein QO010_001336 [Caulobacter ginsengisoli]|uniref:Uncharacterized protein n=1 Tax=Caulobacter ginsengisoli TaxID=400775 RepID=A0ABU0INK8_9CAUL|nr:hypothetical protein [Caulobacter ginsengisoli]MDQ0463565.1 hypothetical protein [Caulobacter ginsengisoli]